MARTAVGLPPALAKRGDRVLRPADAANVYAHPRAELARLVQLRAARRIATGYYALTPQRRIGDLRWKPELDAAALGIARADYGVDAVALMGVSAARYHGAIPRALGVAVVAVPKQRPTLHTDLGRIIFVKRDVTRLDVERIETELGPGWVTTVEQTILDLAARPKLGGLAEQDVKAAIRAMATRTDWSLVERLASEQHKPSALNEAKRLVGRNA
ncbi:MAG TPA: hypothetical protein DGG94_02795 [Micromonosporaceae bacterium]|nr:hypothetical protein [Micromonosporaceae bacterium]HCU48747.1 hypothetical protein [Micromonosporaceae bacterium]